MLYRIEMKYKNPLLKNNITHHLTLINKKFNKKLFFW